jgi:hypothetical protein
MKDWIGLLFLFGAIWAMLGLIVLKNDIEEGKKTNIKQFALAIILGPFFSKWVR